MIHAKQSPPAGDADGLEETSLLGGFDGSSNIPKLEISQEEYDLGPIICERQELPSFFELVTANAAAPIRHAIAYLNACTQLASIHDYDEYLAAGEKFLEAGREFAELLKLLKKPSIISNEAAGRLERKAREIHARGDLFKLEAANMRAVASGLNGENRP
jgi:hypothetical protein